jgi:hypothetical protein
MRTNRRQLLVCSSVLATAALAACKSRDSCPPAALEPEDAKLRETFKYADRSPDPKKLCGGCQQFLPKPEADCGACKLLKGPIHPRGSCVAFAAKT